MIASIWFGCFSGAYDLTVNHDLSRAYLQQLKAPVKGFYLFERSAHSPLVEQPESVMRVLREDVLAGTNKLADTK
jgi:pimeloyl-ACP methyl ester carboxylesterase